jgi:predicted AAA+ superfamily ATPase
LARNISGEATLQSLAVDVAGDGAAMDPKTVARYLDSLERVFAYEALSAWTVNIRSRARLRTSPKHHLADPSLACALLGVGAERLAGDPEFFGQIFESMAIRDLWALVAAESGRVYHYRDSTGLEVDAVLEYPDGTWAAIEVKLGASRVPEAERALLTLRDSRVDVARVGNPSFMAVITATEFAYTLPSGVHVIPLAVLGA